MSDCSSEKLSQSLEDYLETILIVSQEKKIVRVKDLVQRLKVKTASVIGALKKLEQKGFLEHEHYGYIDLTPEGKTVAASIYEKHLMLFRFLTEFLEIPSEAAEKDSCLIEHHISNQTFSRILALVQFIETYPEKTAAWLKEFKGFMKNEYQERSTLAEN